MGWLYSVIVTSLYLPTIPWIIILQYGGEIDQVHFAPFPDWSIPNLYTGYSLGIGDRRILRLLHRILRSNIACFLTELCPSIITLLLVSSILLFLQFYMKPLFTYSKFHSVSKKGYRTANYSFHSQHKSKVFPAFFGLSTTSPNQAQPFPVPHEKHAIPMRLVV